MVPSPGGLLMSLLSPSQPQQTIHQCLALSRGGHVDQLKYTLDKLKRELTGSDDVLLSSLTSFISPDLDGEPVHEDGSPATRLSILRCKIASQLDGLQSKLQHARIVAACQEHGIKTGAEVEEIRNAVHDLILSQSKPGRSWGIGVELVQKWVEQVETLEEQEDLVRKFCLARKKIALVLNRRFWRDDPFRFLDLPSELRLPIYRFLLPAVIESAEEVQCFLNVRKLRVRTNAAPALPTLPNKTNRSENENEMVLPLLLSCRLIHVEVESEIKKRLSKRKYEISVDPEAIYWNGSCKWAFNNRSMVQGHFTHIQRLQLCLYLRTSEQNVEKITTQMEKLVPHLCHLSHLKELDVFLLPYPRREQIVSRLPLHEVAKAVAPLRMLRGVKHATISVNEGVKELASTNDFYVKSWHPGMPSGSEYSSMTWILPNTASEERWKEIQAEVENDMRQPRETAPVGSMD